MKNKYVKTIIILTFVLVCLLAITAFCIGTQSRTAPYPLSQDEINTLTVLAEEKNDAGAALKLYEYYTFSIVHEERNQEKFLRLAAIHGNKFAQHNLAYICYQNKQFDEAYAWAQKAKAGGHYSDDLLDQIISAQIEMQRPSIDAEYVTREKFTQAERVIKKYVHDKYAFDDLVYEISIHTKYAHTHIVQFMIYHQDDQNPTPRFGGGKSFVVEFDMLKMAVLREWHFQ